MSSNLVKKSLSIAARVLLVLCFAVGALKLGSPASYWDAYGIFFVVIGGAALVLISFPVAEILQGLRHAAGGAGSDRELRNSAHLWEAAGRSFWLLGGLRSVLSIVIGFAAMAREETAGLPSVLPMLIQSLLSTFYGSLFAIICFVPCWKISGKVPAREAASNEKTSVGRNGRGFHVIAGYAFFLVSLALTVRIPNLDVLPMWSAYNPALFVVLGGALALVLFMNGSNSRITSSAAFAGMGLVGSLIGFIQMLHAMTLSTPRAIAFLAGALVFVLSSCFTALLGMVLIGAPREDKAIRRGESNGPSTFSRVAWYVFPLISLILLVLVFNMIIMPLPRGH